MRHQYAAECHLRGIRAEFPRHQAQGKIRPRLFHQRIDEKVAELDQILPINP